MNGVETATEPQTLTAGSGMLRCIGGPVDGAEVERERVEQGRLCAGLRYRTEEYSERFAWPVWEWSEDCRHGTTLYRQEGDRLIHARTRLG